MGKGSNEFHIPVWQAQAITNKTLKRNKWRLLLPSEAEWEKASRGDDKRIFPMGDESDKDFGNHSKIGISRTCAVGIFPVGASPYGLLDTSGNVWEWTRSLYSDYPNKSRDGREDLIAGDSVSRVLRGGAFHDSIVRLRCAARSRYDPDYRSNFIGFRLVLSPVL